MGRYLARRLFAFIPVLLIVAILIFLMIDLVPGDPVRQMLGMEADEQSIAARRIELGLNRPVYERLVDWFVRVAQGDLGKSYFLGVSVGDALRERLPITFSLSAFALMVAILVGVSAGIIASINQGSPLDWGVMMVTMVGLSLPSFWLGLNLIFLFAVTWQLFPIGGFVPFIEDPGLFFKHLLLPGLSLGLIHAAVTARMTRACMLEVLRTDYVRTARAKGLAERVVLYRHALRNALIPIVTVVGISAGVMLGGSVVIETVFNLPGVGRLVVEGVVRRDYPVVQGGILLITGAYLVINLLVDLLYAWIDPRIRYD